MATNTAVRGELGCYPILITMLCLSVKYWWSLNRQCLHERNSLAVLALLDNRRLDNTGVFAWSSGIKSTLNLIDNPNIWDKSNILYDSCFNRLILCNLRDKYDNCLIHHVNNFQAKLCSHCKSFGLENYILMFHKSITANFSRLRISAHSSL